MAVCCSSGSCCLSAQPRIQPLHAARALGCPAFRTSRARARGRTQTSALARRVIHAMRGCRGWKHLGGRMERVHGAWKTRKMMWNRCRGSSRASGRAGRGLRACAHMCATALRPLPRHCREEKGLSDTCHPARELPRCREPCQALIQERGLLVLPRGHTFLGATRAAAGEGAQIVDEQMPRAPAPGKLQEDSSPRSNPSC